MSIRIVVLIAAVLAAPAAWAQDAGKPLNLKLPPAGSYPAAAGSAAGNDAAREQTTVAGEGTSATAASNAPTSRAGASTNVSPYRADPPGTWYGDTSGRMGNTGADRAARACDDATYNQPQLHGSVGMGVMGGHHASGDYQAAGVDISQAFGSCEHPTGGMSISIGGTQEHFHTH